MSAQTNAKDATPPVVIDMGERERRLLERDAERAKATQAQILEAIRAQTEARDTTPGGVAVVAHTPDPREEIVRRMFPDAIEEHADRSDPKKVTKPAKITVKFDDPSRHLSLIHI